MHAAPSPPSITRAVATSSTSILVEWSRPSNPNGIIRGYRVTYFAIDSPLTLNYQTVSSEITDLELTGLNIFAIYSVYVEGLTTMYGEASNTVTIKTDEDGKTSSLIVYSA